MSTTSTAMLNNGQTMPEAWRHISVALPQICIYVYYLCLESFFSSSDHIRTHTAHTFPKIVRKPTSTVPETKVIMCWKAVTLWSCRHYNEYIGFACNLFEEGNRCEEE